MALGSGLGGAVGIGAETPGSFGVYGTIARWHDVMSSQLRGNKNVQQDGGIIAGRFLQPGLRRQIITQDASGPINMSVTNQTMGLLLAHIFGNPSIAQQGATIAWLQTHALGDNVGKSLSIQQSVPSTDGVLRPYTFLGSKITAAEFKLTNGFLTVQIDVDAKSVSEAQSYVAASPVAGLRSFSFPQMGVKLGGSVGAETPIQGIKDLSLKFERPQDVERDYANNAGLKSEPLMNDNVKITGSLTADFVDKTIFADRFSSDASAPLVWEFVGPNIASTFFETFRLKVPQIFIEDPGQTLDGPGIINGQIGFTAQNDLTNVPITCEYMSKDIAI